MFAHSVHGMECARVRSVFFLILKEPATELVGETFSPFFNANPLFSADVLKKCALLVLHIIAEEETVVDFKFLVWKRMEDNVGE